jgi:drug/metabolite transporter (DMT)-like permease
MSFLIIAIMCILANAKIVLQSRYAQKLNSFEESIYFNFLMFLSAAIVFLPKLVTSGASRETIISGVLSGLLSVGFQIFYILAFSCGKTTITTVVNSFSMLIPTFLSLWAFDENFGILNAIGVVVVLVSFCFNISKDKEQKLVQSRTKWITYLFLAFVFCGFHSVVQKFYTKLASNLETTSFVAIAYITAVVVAGAILLILRCERKTSINFNKKTIASGLSAGVILSVFQVVSTYGASVVDGSVLYPVYNCASSLLLTSIGVTFFKEKLSKSQFFGILLGIAGVVMLSVK